MLAGVGLRISASGSSFTVKSKVSEKASHSVLLARTWYVPASFTSRVFSVAEGNGDPLRNHWYVWPITKGETNRMLSPSQMLLGSTLSFRFTTGESCTMTVSASVVVAHPIELVTTAWYIPDSVMVSEAVVA